MSGKHETQVLVVGAGPVGLWTALSLTERGIHVQIVDEELRAAAHSYALALHPRSLELLDEIGLAAPLVSRGRCLDAVAFYDGPARQAELRFSELPSPFPFLLVAPQSSLELLLEETLRRRGVRVMWNHRVSALALESDLVIADVDRLSRATYGYGVATTEWVIDKRLQTRAQFVIGADGHRSIVRSAANIAYQPAGSGTSFAVFEFETDAELDQEVRVVLDAETSNVLWPLADGRCRWSFQLTSADGGEQRPAKGRLAVPLGTQAFPHLSVKELKVLLESRAPWFDGNVGDLHWAMQVRFERRLADPLGVGRVWLAGDAAHLAGPIGIHSSNLGIREGAELAAAMPAALTQGSWPESLMRFGRDHLAELRFLLGLDAGPVSTDETPAWVRERRERLLPCVPATGDHLTELLRQVGLQRPRST